MSPCPKCGGPGHHVALRIVRADGSRDLVEHACAVCGVTWEEPRKAPLQDILRDWLRLL